MPTAAPDSNTSTLASTGSQAHSLLRRSAALSRVCDAQAGHIGLTSGAFFGLSFRLRDLGVTVTGRIADNK